MNVIFVIVIAAMLAFIGLTAVAVVLLGFPKCPACGSRRGMIVKEDESLLVCGLCGTEWTED